MTVDPAAIACHALERVDGVFAVGTRPAETVAAFCQAIGAKTPPVPSRTPERGQAVHWARGSNEPPEVVTLHPPAEKSERHKRKYADVEFGEDKSFYFRGPRGALNLHAHNLMMFLQIADGVDDETWRYHLEQHDLSRWIRNAIKDGELADEVETAEEGSDPGNARRRVREAIERRYKAPANSAEDVRTR